MSQHSPRPLFSSGQDTGRPVIVIIRPSVLRLGLGARLAGAACLVAGIWIVIGWVLK